MEIIGVLIAALSLSFDIYNHIINDKKNKNKNINNLILNGLVNIAPNIKMWKELHTKFHAMRYLFRDMIPILLTNDGLPKDNIKYYSDNDKKKIQHILSNIINFDHINYILDNSSIYFKDIDKNIVNSNNVNDRINIILNNKTIKLCNNDVNILQRARELYKAQKNVRESLEQLTDIMNYIVEIAQHTTWSDIEFQKIIDNRQVFIRSYDIMIAQTDIILMIILEIQLWFYEKIDRS